MREIITTIIPNYNRASTILSAVDSVLSQTYDKIEVIVVDDCSTDNSVEILDGIRDERLKVIQLNDNKGACVARNVGVNNARGDYIAFLDSDDTWHKDKLEKQILFLKNSEYDSVASAYNYHSLNGKCKIRPKENAQNQRLMPSFLAERNVVTTGTILAKKKCFNSIKFDERLSRYQDWDLALQLSKMYKMGFQNVPLLEMYEQKNSITNTTSYEKKYYSLCLIYKKHRDLYRKNSKAESQMLWSLGMYSLLSNNSYLEYVSEAIEHPDTPLYRKAIYLLLSIGGEQVVKKLYSVHH